MVCRGHTVAGGQIDDRTSARFAHGWNRVFAGQHGAFEIEIKSSLPLVFVNLADPFTESLVAAEATEAKIVDQHVQPPIAFDGCGDHGTAVLALRGVARKHRCFAAHFVPDLGGGACRILLGDIDDQDLGSFFRQANRRGPAGPQLTFMAAGPGDNGHFAGQS